MFPATLTFGRQQLGELTKIDDDVLGYWIREGLLQPVTGSDGKGKHRRFDYRQVNIAALLGEMRRIGVNIGGLRSFAAILQRGVEIADSGPWTVNDLASASSVFFRISEFLDGRPRRLSSISEKKLAQISSIDDVIDDYMSILVREVRDPVGIANLARCFDHYDYIASRAYSEMHYDSNLVERIKGSVAEDWDELIWHVSPEPDGGWYIGQPDFFEVKKRKMRSAVALGVSIIIRRLWVPEPAEVTR